MVSLHKYVFFWKRASTDDDRWLKSYYRQEKKSFWSRILVHLIFIEVIQKELVLLSMPILLQTVFSCQRCWHEQKNESIYWCRISDSLWLSTTLHLPVLISIVMDMMIGIEFLIRDFLFLLKFFIIVWNTKYIQDTVFFRALKKIAHWM